MNTRFFSRAFFAFCASALAASAASLTNRYEFNGNLKDSVGALHGVGTQAGEASAPVSFDAGRPAGASGPIASLRVGHVEGTVSGFTIRNFAAAETGSVSFWFKSERANAGEGADWILNAGGTYNKDFRVGVSANGSMLEANIAKTNGGLGRLKEDTWYHVVITWDKAAGTAKVYLDGAPSSKVREWTDPELFQPNAIRVGNWAFSPRYVVNQFSGLIYDLQIYSGELTPEEVKRLFAAPGSVAGSAR